MSVTALITGRLFAEPARRTCLGGKVVALAKVAAATDDGDSLVSVIAFGNVTEQLLELGKGDTVTLTGRAKVASWSDRDGNHKSGLSLTSDALLTAYHLRRNRAAMAQEEQAPGGLLHVLPAQSLCGGNVLSQSTRNGATSACCIAPIRRMSPTTRARRVDTTSGVTGWHPGR